MNSQSMKALIIKKMREAFEFLEEASQDPELFKEYQRLQEERTRRIMYALDQKASRDYWRERAPNADGETILAMSRANMLKGAGFDLNTIPEITSLSKEEILAL